MSSAAVQRAELDRLATLDQDQRDGITWETWKAGAGAALPLVCLRYWHSRCWAWPVHPPGLHAQ
jgi:hypothetical protein